VGSAVSPHASAPVSRPLDWSSVEGLILDMDGVLWRGTSPLPGIAELFACLKQRGLGFALATNNSAHRPVDFVARLGRSGLVLAEGQVITSAVAAAVCLRHSAEAGATVFAIGEAGLREAISREGFQLAAVAGGTGPPPDGERVAAVAVGYDRELTYAKLRDAAVYLQRGALFVAANRDAAMPVEGSVWPGTGATVAALELTTGRRAKVAGKPEAAMFAAASEALKAPADRLVMVGDRLDTDIAGAARAGMRSVLVTTGVNSAADVEASPWRPDLVVAGLAELAAAIAAGASHFS
jgi:4-nitrophenyl phosphatase